MTMTPTASAPPTPVHRYNQHLSGVYGEFGSGAGSRAFYLQSAMTPSQLKDITLVSDIPGSDKWPVRALFQREINTNRVMKGLIPYLRDATQVRFFNPLTLTLLPMRDNKRSVRGTIPDLITDSQVIDEREWIVLERRGFYRLRWIRNEPQYAVLEWDSARSHLVAIDGQHRLFGLRAIWSGSADLPASEDFQAWRIPVVVVSFRSQDHGTTAPSVLDIVRRIFVSINTQAHQVNEAREILLSDNSINALCTQELVESAHANDRKRRTERDATMLPLLVFDWRGEEDGTKAMSAPTALHSIVEIRNWFRHYILGKDLTPKQKTVMNVVPTSPLNGAFVEERITHSHSELVREWAREDLLPAVTHLLSRFTPSAQYIEALRALEARTLDPKEPELVRHAFDKLRFGTNHAEGLLRDKIDSALSTLLQEIEDAKKNSLDRLFRDDIGFRGVAWAFGFLRNRFAGPPNWKEYAEHYTGALNAASSDGWLAPDKEQNARCKELLLHIAEDSAGERVNYRLGSAHALGTHVALLVAAYGLPWPKEWKFSWSQFLEERLDAWRSVVEQGYKRQYRADLQVKYFTSTVRSKAAQAARRRAARMRAALEDIVRTHNQE